MLRTILTVSVAVSVVVMVLGAVLVCFGGSVEQVGRQMFGLGFSTSVGTGLALLAWGVADTVDHINEIGS